MGLQHAQRLADIPARSRQEGQEAQDQQGGEEVPAAWNSTPGCDRQGGRRAFMGWFHPPASRSRWNGPGLVGPSTQRRVSSRGCQRSAMPSANNERMRKTPPALPSEARRTQVKACGWTCVCTPNGLPIRDRAQGCALRPGRGNPRSSRLPSSIRGLRISIRSLARQTPYAASMGLA